MTQTMCPSLSFAPLDSVTRRRLAKAVDVEGLAAVSRRIRIGKRGLERALAGLAIRSANAELIRLALAATSQPQTA